MATITVLYPTATDATFDLDYYLASHMKLVQSKWGGKGLKGWKVAKLAEANDTSNPYSIAATLDFSSTDDFQKAVADDGDVVLGDIPNFSNKQPTIAAGKVVGTS